MTSPPTLLRRSFVGSLTSLALDGGCEVDDRRIQGGE